VVEPKQPAPIGCQPYTSIKRGVDDEKQTIACR